METVLPLQLQAWLETWGPDLTTGMLAASMIAAGLHLMRSRRTSAGKPECTAVPARVPAPVAAPESTGRMGAAGQWIRLTSVVETSIDRSHRIQDLHTSASRQLDSTDYALHCLVQEMQHVMAMQLRTPLSREPARPEPAPAPEPKIAYAA